MQTAEQYKLQIDTLESNIIYLYLWGLTTREIKQMIETIYGQYYGFSI